MLLDLTQQLCNVSVVVDADAELDESSVDDVSRTEHRIVSQWRAVSADEKHQMREQVDEILRPIGLQTRLLVVERANSLALYFLCMALSAVIRLRVQWSSSETLSSHCLLFSQTPLIKSVSKDSPGGRMTMNAA